MKFLYCYKKGTRIENQKNWINEDIKVFTPQIWNLMLPGENWNTKTVIGRLMFQMISKGKAKIYYVHDGNDLKHRSYVIPKCSKFPFLGASDYEIGPCYTEPKYRGRGIYPTMLKWICESVGNQDTTFYMIVDENNVSSIKGIEKAGFVKCGTVEVTKYTRRYRLV